MSEVGKMKAVYNSKTGDDAEYQAGGKECSGMGEVKQQAAVTPWIHKVQYYETDQMQVVHHSNFVRWFEECRVHVLDEIGYGYDRLEMEGIMSPVLSIEAKIVKSVRFGETVKIQAAIDKFDGIRLTLKYQVLREDDDVLCCTGTTGHCFLGKDGRLISLKRSYPKVYEALCAFPTEFD